MRCANTEAINRHIDSLEEPEEGIGAGDTCNAKGFIRCDGELIVDSDVTPQGVHFSYLQCDKCCRVVNIED